MLRRFGTKAGVTLALALFAITALAPMAEADHTYSHRYVVFGRVVDAAGNPVQGLGTNLGYRDFQPEGACANQPNTETEAFGVTRTTPVTNEYGEFIFCFHAHRMSDQLEGHGIIDIAELQLTHEFEFDAHTRHSFVFIQLNETHPRANPTILDESYTIMGNVWRETSKDTYLDGVKVYGLTIDNAPVNITFTYNGNEPIRLNATTNAYGNFAIRVPVTERPTSGTVTIEVANETVTHPIDGTYGVTAAKVTLERVSDPFLSKLLIGAGILAAVAVVGGGSWYGVRKMQARREEERARGASTRRRANK